MKKLTINRQNFLLNKYRKGVALNTADEGDEVFINIMDSGSVFPVVRKGIWMISGC